MILVNVLLGVFLTQTSFSLGFELLQSMTSEPDISISISVLLFLYKQSSNKTGSLLLNNSISLLFVSELIKTDSGVFGVSLDKLSNFLVFFLAH